MGVDRSRDVLTGLGAPIETTFWDGESGEYDAGGARLGPLYTASPTAGIPIPSADTPCALQAIGPQDAAETLTVATRRAGVPGPDLMGVIWSDTSKTMRRGHDVHTRPRYYSLLSAGHCHTPQLLSLSDGTVVLTYWTDATHPTPGIQVAVYDPNTDTWGAATTLETWSAWNPRPCLCRVEGPGGQDRVILYAWREVTATQIQVHAWHSDDLVTWTEVGDVLEEALSGSTYTERYRLQAGRLPDGQTLLLGHVRYPAAASVQDVMVQWGARDGGTSFSHVETWDGSANDAAGAQPVIIQCPDRLVVAWLAITTVGPYRTAFVAQVFDAYQRVRLADLNPTLTAHYSVGAQVTGARAWFILGAGFRYDDGELAGYYSGDGCIHLYGRDAALGCVTLYRSQDYGHTWIQTGPSDRWSDGQQVDDPQAIGECLEEIAACESLARGLIVTGYQTGAALSEDLIQIWSGGWCAGQDATATSSRPCTLPHRGASLSPRSRTSWERTYRATCVPGATGWLTAAGAGGEVVTAGRDVVTAPRTYTALDGAGVGSVAEGQLVEVAVQVDATTPVGTVAYALRARAGDGVAASSYEVEVRIQNVIVIGWQAILWDVVAGAPLGTVSISVSGRLRILLAATSRARAWVATSDRAADRIWTEVGAGALVDSGAIGAGRVQSDWYRDGYQDEMHRSWRGYTGDQMTESTRTHVRYLYPYPVLPPGVGPWPAYLGDGVSVQAQDGPSSVDDTWSIPPSGEYPVVALDVFTVPDPRHTMRTRLITAMAAGTAGVRLAWQIAGADERQPTDWWLLYLDGVQQPGGTVWLRYAGAWNQVASLGSDTWAVIRAGRRLYVDTTGAGGSASYGLGDLAGCGCAIVSGGVAWTGVISTCTEGTSRVTAGQVSRRVVVTLEDDTGAPASGTLTVWPRRHLVAVRLSAYSRDVRAVQVRFPIPAAGVSPGRPSTGYLELGAVVPCAGYLFAWPYSQDASRATIIQDELSTASDGSRVARVLGPSRTRWELHWSDEVPTGDTRTGSFPDYATVATGGDPTAWLRGMTDLVPALVAELRQTGAPCVLVPGLTRPSTGGWQRRAYGALLGRVVDAEIVADYQHGDPNIDETARLQSLTFEGEGS